MKRQTPSALAFPRTVVVECPHCGVNRTMIRFFVYLSFSEGFVAGVAVVLSALLLIGLSANPYHV